MQTVDSLSLSNKGRVTLESHFTSFTQMVCWFENMTLSLTSLKIA